jgi:hypothetical protein
LILYPETLDIANAGYALWQRFRICGQKLDIKGHCTHGGAEINSAQQSVRTDLQSPLRSSHPLMNYQRLTIHARKYAKVASAEEKSNRDVCVCKSAVDVPDRMIEISTPRSLHRICYVKNDRNHAVPSFLVRLSFGFF